MIFRDLAGKKELQSKWENDNSKLERELRKFLNYGKMTRMLE